MGRLGYEKSQWVYTRLKQRVRVGRHVNTPSLITTTPFIPNDMTKKVDLSNNFHKLINLPERNVVKVTNEYQIKTFLES